MKILRLILKNYGAIKTGMQCDKITVDFSKSENKIILISGPNGSGKTAILSSLHPFATNGTFDVRSKQPLIVDGKNGYKEIVIKNNDDVYTIKHYYTPSKTSFTVKSYIKKNDMELNENGNVTSFMNLVKDELGLDMDYLRLMRLGANVTNFIGMTGLARKTYMGNLINSADIYIQYNKKLTNDMRELKNILSHVVDKMRKLGISDIDVEKDKKSAYEADIDNLKKELTEITQKLGITEYEISKLNTKENIIAESKSVKSKLDDVDKTLNKKSFSKMKSNTDASELQNMLNEYKSKHKFLIEKRDVYLEIIDSVSSKLDDATRNLHSELNNENIKSLENIIASINSDIASTDPSILEKVDDVKCTSDDVLELMQLLNAQEDLMTTTRGFGNGPIKQAIKIITNKKDIDDIYRQKETSHNQSLAKICTSVFEELTNGEISKPKCKDTSCPAYKLYDEILNAMASEKDTKVESEEFYTYTEMAYNNIKLILRNITEKKELIEKMPIMIKNIFITDTLFNNMKNLEPLFDMKLVNSFLTLVKECDNYKDKMRLLAEKENELSAAKKSSNLSYWFDSVKNLTWERTKASSTIDDINSEISSLTNKIDETDDLLVMATSYNDITEKKESLEKRKTELIDECNKLNDLNNERMVLKDKENNLTFSINKKTKELNDLSYKISEYKSMKKELNYLEDEYDELELIKRATSSKEGIPTILIERYFSSIRTITNQLLENVYNRELKIIKFDIQPDSFNIPYKRKDTIVPDAMYASDGERSCISLALSFALSYKSMCDYNIMLLDEIDGVLDNDTRMNFVQILECLIDMVQMEQVFIISHNNVFDSYPLDTLYTTDYHEEKSSIGTIINIKKECTAD